MMISALYQNVCSDINHSALDAESVNHKPIPCQAQNVLCMNGWIELILMESESSKFNIYRENNLKHGMVAVF